MSTKTTNAKTRLVGATLMAAATLAFVAPAASAATPWRAPAAAADSRPTPCDDPSYIKFAKQNGQNYCYTDQGSIDVALSGVVRTSSGNWYGSFVYHTGGEDHTLSFGCGGSRDWPGDGIFVTKVVIGGQCN